VRAEDSSDISLGGCDVTSRWQRKRGSMVQGDTWRAAREPATPTRSRLLKALRALTSSGLSVGVKKCMRCDGNLVHTCRASLHLGRTAPRHGIADRLRLAAIQQPVPEAMTPASWAPQVAESWAHSPLFHCVGSDTAAHTPKRQKCQEQPRNMQRNLHNGVCYICMVLGGHSKSAHGSFWATAWWQQRTSDVTHHATQPPRPAVTYACQ
jgi:hypothetical protein